MNDKKTYPNIARLNPKACISGKIRRCKQLITQVFRKHIAPFHITSSQLSILFVTAKQTNVTQSVLSKVLILEKSTVSRNLRRLLEKGYIHKNEKQRLMLTTAGKDLLEQVIPAWEKAMKEIRTTLKEDGEEALNLLIGKLQF